MALLIKRLSRWTATNHLCLAAKYGNTLIMKVGLLILELGSVSFSKYLQ
jgi:hypothetical protein